MVVNIIDNLQSLGLSENEAKVYIGLLKGHPLTAYEAAKASGVPTSKVYQVLDRLLEKNLVMEISDQERKRYVPLEADDMVDLFRNRLTSTLDGLKQDLQSLSVRHTVSYIWNISDYGELIRKAAHLVGSAKKSILVSAWDPELRTIETVLRAREREGLKTGLVHFGETGVAIRASFAHPIEDTLYQEKGGRGFTIVIDSREALVATVSGGSETAASRVEGAWSRNSGFVTLAEDYIKHDIYIMKIVRRFDALLIATFGDNYHRLRDVFSDTEETKQYSNGDKV